MGENMKADIGLCGLGVMGKNLVLNLADHGYTVAVYNRTAEKAVEFAASPEAAGRVVACASPREFVDAIKKPAPIILMIKAGKPVDDEIENFLPHLEKGDIVIDCGNSFFKDTLRRTRYLAEKGFAYLGVGVSGGEEGARNGPSIMPGGDPDAYARVRPMFEAISAKVDGQPCCTYIGADAAGHYVKMVHNGIEYADMQLIGEAYFLLRHLCGLGASEMADVFSEWNRGELSSYLIEITADILRRKDDHTDRPLVEMILDKAGQKGTGAWTSENALSLGLAAPTVAEAVFARNLSALKDERVAASAVLPGPTPKPLSGDDKTRMIAAVRGALYAAKICCYAQGFALMNGAAKEYGWKLGFGDLAMIWRGGCIIRAVFLSRIKEAYEHSAGLPNLLLDPYFTDAVAKAQAGWREVAALAIGHGVPVPAFTSALAYYDGYRSADLWANLIQAQRDYFGAHTYERTDRPGTFHTEWMGE